jgi:WD40 repeat protein
VPIKDPNQKKTLTHKKKITALTLSNDGTRLISGDSQGLIYIWLLTTEELTLKTFELHKDKGAITNLVALERPLSLFGLTANMNGYDPN